DGVGDDPEHPEDGPLHPAATRRLDVLVGLLLVDHDLSPGCAMRCSEEDMRHRRAGRWGAVPTRSSGPWTQALRATSAACCAIESASLVGTIISVSRGCGVGVTRACLLRAAFASRSSSLPGCSTPVSIRSRTIGTFW